MKVFLTLKNALFNVFYYKVLLIFFLVPTILVPCITFDYKLLFIMMGWGAVICLYDLFKRRNFLKARGMIWLIPFLVIFLVSVLLNFKTVFNLNVSSWAYSVIALLLLYPDSSGSKEKALKELSVLNNIFIGVTAVLSTISIGMFVVGYFKAVEYGDLIYDIGWNPYKHRLFGLYSNTGYMITSIALAMIIVQAVVTKTRSIKARGIYKAFLIYTAVVNFICAALENAKGAFISLCAFLVVFFFAATLKKLKDKNKHGFGAFLTSTICGLLAAVVFVGGVYAVRPVLSFVPGLYQSVFGSDSGDMDADELESIEMDRDIPEKYGFLTGRTIIWKFGLSEFKNKPIFGYGPQSHREYKVVDIGLRHFHNIVVQSLVSVGIAGSIFVLGFFLTVLWFMFKSLIRLFKENDRFYSLSAALFAIIIMFIVNGMAEVTILFLPRISMFLFWLFMGYLNIFLGGENNTLGTKLLSKLDLFLEKILSRKAALKNEK